MAQAQPISTVEPQKADIPKGHVKVDYRGFHPHFARSLPYSLDELEGKDIVWAGRTVYVFDKKDEDGVRYVTTSHPVHVWFFLSHKRDGEPVFHVHMRPAMKKKIDVVQAGLRLDIQTGAVRSRKEADEADATLAAMG